MPRNLSKLIDYPEFGHWVLIKWNDAPPDWWIAGRKDSPKDKCATMLNPLTGEIDTLNFDQIIEARELELPK